MTEPTVTLNPTQQLVAEANASFEVEDKRGRKITLRKPGVLAQFRMIEALGESASNTTYVGMVLTLIFIAAIDGDAVVQPTSKRQVEALIQRLDDAGWEAVMTGVEQHFGKTDVEKDKEALKNA